MVFLTYIVSIMVEKRELEKIEFLNIPTYVLCDRDISILESIVEYLKEKRKMTYAEIGRILNRNERTIWTCYQRAKKKRGSK